ncbi:hypothetical protein CSOJ01_07105 [Colletotrichum sojae]|uniref:Uncharacterized protein n=1 Tax=Colletotrichum sojae TaxID=2175907 RepID=A0A8H6MUU1_9PEZI|nr:hypothetical protein CSOJ01_07105 [Colletotrichum sojae]
MSVPDGGVFVTASCEEASWKDGDAQAFRERREKPRRAVLDGGDYQQRDGEHSASRSLLLTSETVMGVETVPP